MSADTFAGAQAVARRFHRLSDVMDSDPSIILASAEASMKCAKP